MTFVIFKKFYRFSSKTPRTLMSEFLLVLLPFIFNMFSDVERKNQEKVKIFVIILLSLLMTVSFLVAQSLVSERDVVDLSVLNISSAIVEELTVPKIFQISTPQPINELETVVTPRDNTTTVLEIFFFDLHVRVGSGFRWIRTSVDDIFNELEENIISDMMDGLEILVTHVSSFLGKVKSYSSHHGNG